MDRRNFLRLSTSAVLLSAAPRAFPLTGESGTDWRTYELEYKVDLSRTRGAGKLWLPVPQDTGDYQRVLSIDWQGSVTASFQSDPVYQAPMVTAQWDLTDTDRAFTAVMQIAVRDNRRALVAGKLRSAADAALYLQPTKSMPNDGIVLDTASKIVKGLVSPDAKARAIYEWIVDNTFRNPKTQGCGLGDIKYMLESGNLSGKCADINSLFVGLARAVGIPAREFYGVRIDDSAQFRSLGKSGNISKAQHCRAEYFSERYGWVPVDPADVRKVVLEEKLNLDDPVIVALRERLFGYWEMNWVGFNNARDLNLPGYSGKPMPYLMYPFAVFGNTRLNGLNPDKFVYELSSRRLS